jgi:hypothetical protein
MLLGHLGYYIVAVPRDEEAHLFEVKNDLFSGWSQGCCLCYNDRYGIIYKRRRKNKARA